MCLISQNQQTFVLFLTLMINGTFSSKSHSIRFAPINSLSANNISILHFQKIARNLCIIAILSSVSEHHFLSSNVHKTGIAIQLWTIPRVKILILVFQYCRFVLSILNIYDHFHKKDVRKSANIFSSKETFQKNL